MALDPGQEETDELLAEIETILKFHFKQAKEDLGDKILNYWKKFIKKDSIMKAMLEAKEILPKEYSEWRIGQLMIGKRWSEMRYTIAEDLTNAQNIAKSIVNGYAPEAYSIGFNYGTYEVEKAAQIDTSFTLYDRSTVERLVRDSPQLLPELNPVSKTAQEIADGKIIAWHESQIQSVTMQGVLQGESIPEIADKISEITLQDEKATIRYARTMMNGAENGGRIDSYKRAGNMGIQLEQQWLATLDERTRKSHRQLDGEHKPVGTKFSNGCRFPGDPQAPAAEIWNCRCTLIPLLTGIPGLDLGEDVTDLGQRNTDHMEEAGYKTYEEWKQGKPKPHRITEQKEKGENIRQAWNAKYKKAAKRLGVKE